MANHVRQQIREQIASTLNNLTTTGNRVYQSRVYPIATGGTPALLVYTKSEESEPVVIGTNRLTSRDLSVAVEIYVKATSNFDDIIDTSTKEIEIAIATDPTLNGLAKDCYLESTEIIFNTEGEQPLGFATLIFLTNYYVKAQAPDVAV